MTNNKTIKSIKELKTGDIINCFDKKYYFKSKHKDNGRYIGLNLINLNSKKSEYYSYHDSTTFEVEAKNDKT